MTVLLCIDHDEFAPLTTYRGVEALGDDWSVNKMSGDVVADWRTVHDLAHERASTTGEMVVLTSSCDHFTMDSMGTYGWDVTGQYLERLPHVPPHLGLDREESPCSTPSTRI